MILFWLIGAVMVVIALAFILPPLWQKNAETNDTSERDEAKHPHRSLRGNVESGERRIEGEGQAEELEGRTEAHAGSGGFKIEGNIAKADAEIDSARAREGKAAEALRRNTAAASERRFIRIPYCGIWCWMEAARVAA